MAANADTTEESPFTRRELPGRLGTLAVAISVVWGSYHLLVASGFYLPPPTVLRAVHLGFGMILCFLLAPAWRRSPRTRPSLVDWLLIAATAGTMGYVVFRYETLVRMGGQYDPPDIWVGVVGTLLLFEAARRTVSPGLTWLAALAILFAYFGRSVPEPFTHSGFSVNRIVQHLFLSGEGIFGFILGVSAEIIIVFVLFGAVLEGVGVADFFYRISNAVAGGTRGGPAKIAVISSALMGMVSGETSANVATTGAFTIPLMKRVGYPNYFAGAVEASASAGGQILPPVMGATAFVIADSLGIPYVKLALAAFLPATLYFVGVFATVHFRAVRMGLSGLARREIPPFWATLKHGYLMAPLAGIVVFLLLDYTPTFAAFWGGIVAAVAITSLRRETRLTWPKIVRFLVRATRTAMSLAVACALVGVVVGVASLTGVTMTIAHLILRLTGGSLLPALALTMLVALVFGMGLPTTAAYVLTAISAVPVLERLGVPQIPAHLFVFYFGALSALTPPVCTGAYTAAGLAGADPNQTGFASVRIALSGFIAPFLFVYDQELVLTALSSPFAVIEPYLTAALGITLLSAVLEGALLDRLAKWERAGLGVVALLLVLPEHITNYLGMASLTVYVVQQLRRRRAASASVVPVASGLGRISHKEENP
jgi:TRAP transporter 4TM/12TM fusion protein